MSERRTHSPSGSVATRSTAGPPRLAEDWLPLVRPQTTLGGKVLHQADLEENQHRDWFFAFAVAMFETDPLQGRMVAKFYLFLRDFIPQGLIGGFSHIKGSEVMDQLLSHPPESAMSRHKVTKAADTAFNKLGTWMGTHKNWQTALRTAKKDAEGEKRGSGKKKLGGKAPGLQSPTALLATLIISHPDTEAKFRKWIGRLQINWMIRPRETINVCSGFWKGLNSTNLDLAFATESEEQRKAETVLVADYTRLFGDAFLSARKDIRPYLDPSWVDRLVPPAEDPSDVEDEQDGDIDRSTAKAPAREDSIVVGSPVGAPIDDSAAGIVIEDSDESDSSSGSIPAGEPAESQRGREGDETAADTGAAGGAGESSVAHKLSQVSPDEAARLRERLNAAGPDPDALEKWLVARLGEDDKLLADWCTSWVGEVDAVDNYQDQMIVRSLFMHSLRWVHNLSTYQPLADAFMLADIQDMDDREMEPPPPDKLAAIRKNTYFATYNTAQDELNSLVGASINPAVRRLVAGKFSDRADFFCNFTRRSTFFRKWDSLVIFETLFLRAIILGHQQPTLARDDIDFLVSNRNSLLNETVVTALKLRTWQIFALVLPGSFQVLTDWQARVFQSTSGDKAEETVDLSDLRPMPLTRLRPYPTNVQESQPHLQKLLGNVKQPYVAKEPSSAPPATLRAASDPVSPGIISTALTPTSAPEPAPQPTPTTAPAPTSAPSTPAESRHRLSQDVTAGTHNVDEADHPSIGASTAVPGSLVTSPASTNPTSLASAYDAKHRRQSQETPLEQPRPSSALGAGPSTAIPPLPNGSTPFQRPAPAASIPGSSRRNLFGAPSQTPEKRRLSPHPDGRTPKMPRLGGGIVTRDDLADQIEKLREELTSGVERMGDELIASMTERADTEAAQSRKTLKELGDAVKKWQGDVHKLAQSVRTQKLSDTASNISQMRSVLDELDIKGAVREALKAEREEQLSPGGYKYLSQCLAPDGWSQQEYENALVRAAMLYISVRGDCTTGTAGLTADPTDLDTVIQTYPELDEGHVVMAIEHMHMLAYGCLLQRE